jgi:heme O synthase-like polyprenyltransferase
MEWKEEFTLIKGSVIAGLLCTVIAGYFIIREGSVDHTTLFMTWIISSAVIYGICIAYRGVEKLNRKLEKKDTQRDE